MTTDTLDFPPIEAAPPQTSVATSITAAITPIDLAKIELTAVALAQYGDWRNDVAATKANLSTLVLDLSTPTKIKEARTLRQRLIGDPLASLRKVATGIKSKMAQTSKAVGAELEQIEAAYAGADKLILPQIEKREEELEQERLKKAKEEAERKAKHESGINRIRAYAVKASEPDMTAARIHAGIQMLEAMPTPTAEAWEEFAVPAANAICETLEKMRALHAKALADEAAAAEAERVRKENEELRAKLAAAEAAAAAAKPAEPPAAAAPTPLAERLVEVIAAEKIAAGGKPAEPNTPQQGANSSAHAVTSTLQAGAVIRAPGGPFTLIEQASPHPPRDFRRSASAHAPTPLAEATPAELRNEWALFEHSLGHVMPVVEKHAAAVDTTRFMRAVERMRAIFLANEAVQP